MIKRIIKVVALIAAAVILLPLIAAFLIPFFIGDDTTTRQDVMSTSMENSITGSLFQHPPSGWRFEIPEGWQLQDAQVADALYRESKNMVETSTGQKVPTVEKPSGELALIHSPGNTLNYKYQVYDKNRFPTYDSVVNMLRDTSTESFRASIQEEGFTVNTEQHKQLLGQKEADVIKIGILNPQQQTVLLSQSYMADFGENIALITLICNSDETCSSIISAVEASSF